MRAFTSFLAGASLLTAAAGYAIDNGLALTPPMGWNSWNAMGGQIDEAGIREVVDSMVSIGLRDAGYVYVNLDDNWMASGRDSRGRLRGDPVRFPSGMKALGDYIHSKGMKFGIYGDRGSATCMGIPESGSYGHEVIDAETFAEWGVDYLKYDNCRAVGDQREAYVAMGMALRATGRPVMYSICSWSFKAPWQVYWGNLWRTTGDITPTWLRIKEKADINSRTYAFAGPGHWNDPDMMEVGNKWVDDAIGQAHFSMWSVMASPLIIGTRMRGITTATKETFLNREVIAVNQDSLGVQGWKIPQKDTSTDVYVKPLGTYGGHRKAVVLVNRSEVNSAVVSVKWTDMGLAEGAAKVRDLWRHQDLGPITDGYSATLPKHSAVMLIIEGKSTHKPMSGGFISDITPIFEWHSTGPAEKDRSFGGKTAGDGKPITIAGKVYSKGLGVSSNAMFWYNLGRQGRRFTAVLGLDDEVAKGAASADGVDVRIVGDGRTLYSAGIAGAPKPYPVDIDLTGIENLRIFVDAIGSTSSDHLDLADARISTVADGVSTDPRSAAAPRLPAARPVEFVNGALQVRMADASELTIRCYEVNGKLDGIFVLGRMPAGVHRVPIGSLSRSWGVSGAYIIRVSIGAVAHTLKVHTLGFEAR